MAGMNVATGKKITGMDHIRQSIADILTTPVGSRVERRDYGSMLPALIDQPLTGATLLRAYSAVVVALSQWEPRIQLERIVTLVNGETPGSASLEMDILRANEAGARSERITVNIATGSN